MKIINRRTIPVYYSVYKISTSEGLGSGTLAPNEMAGYNFEYQPKDGDSLQYCVVYLTTTPKVAGFHEHVHVAADATITVATDIRDGALGGSVSGDD